MNSIIRTIKLMRYFYTLIVTAFLAVSANAQSVISEVDWTQETNYPLDMYCTGYGEPFYYISDEGLVINSNPAEGAEYWNPQVPMIGHIPELKKGEDYLVKFRIITPAAGEIRLDLCSWDGSGAYSPVVINVEAGEKEYVVDFPNYPTDCTDALIYYQCGHLPGKHVIKTVQVFDLNGGGESTERESVWKNNGQIAEVNWSSEYRFAVEGHQTGEECCIVPQATWEKIKAETFYATVRGTNPQIRVTTGWWDTNLTGDNDIMPGDDLLADNGDGTFTLTVNLANAPELSALLDEHHLLFTGSGFSLEEIYFANATGIQIILAAKTDSVMYNLAGQRVDASYKGVVIQNGKKRIVR